MRRTLRRQLARAGHHDGRQFGAGGASVGPHARRPAQDGLPRLQHHRPRSPAGSSFRQGGGGGRGRAARSMLARLLVALGSASSEPLIPVKRGLDPAQRGADVRHAQGCASDHTARDRGGGARRQRRDRGPRRCVHLSKFPGALHVFLRAAGGGPVKAIMARFSITRKTKQAPHETDRRELERPTSSRCTGTTATTRHTTWFSTPAGSARGNGGGVLAALSSRQPIT